MRSRSSLSCCTLILTLFSAIATTQSSFGQDCQVKATVRLLDRHEHTVSDVTAAQLKAEVGDTPAKVVSFLSGTKPSVILLIDGSTSMESTWHQSLAAAKQLADSADHIAVFVFREAIVGRANGHVETSQLLDQLAALKTIRGGTALYDTLVDIGGGVKDRDTALVVITDGGDNQSRHTSDQTVRLFLQSSWPPVFGLVLDYDEQNPQRANFKKVVTGTGGFALYPSSARKVTEAARDLASEIYAPFTITLQLPKPVSKPAKLELKIVDADGKPRHDIQLAHVAEITDCEPTPNSPAKGE